MYVEGRSDRIREEKWSIKITSDDNNQQKWIKFTKKNI